MSNQKKIAELQAQAKKIQDQIEQLKGKDSLSELAKKVEGKCLLLEDRLFLKVHATKDDDCLFFEGTEDGKAVDDDAGA